MRDDPNESIYDRIAREQRRTLLLFGVIILLGLVGLAWMVAKKLTWL